MKRLLLVSTIVLSGCAQISHYQPTVDVFNDNRAAYIQQDLYECHYLACQAANTGTDTLLGSGTGVLLGAAGGAVAGAFVGNPAIGAAIGAAAGGFGGASSSGFDANSIFKRAYRNCMRNRGHNVIN